MKRGSDEMKRRRLIGLLAFALLRTRRTLAVRSIACSTSSPARISRSLKVTQSRLELLNPLRFLIFVEILSLVSSLRLSTSSRFSESRILRTDESIEREEGRLIELIDIEFDFLVFVLRAQGQYLRLDGEEGRDVPRADPVDPYE